MVLHVRMVYAPDHCCTVVQANLNATFPGSPPAMRAKVGVTTSPGVALSVKWRIRMPTEVAFIQRRMIATTRRGRSFTVVITTTMIETSKRIVVEHCTRPQLGHPATPTGCVFSRQQARARCSLIFCSMLRHVSRREVVARSMKKIMNHETLLKKTRNAKWNVDTACMPQ